MIIHEKKNMQRISKPELCLKRMGYKEWLWNSGQMEEIRMELFLKCVSKIPK